jgi:uncharacterized protein YrzB (UPF0473 family)
MVYRHRHTVLNLVDKRFGLEVDFLYLSALDGKTFDRVLVPGFRATAKDDPSSEVFPVDDIVDEESVTTFVLLVDASVPEDEAQAESVALANQRLRHRLVYRTSEEKCLGLDTASDDLVGKAPNRLHALPGADRTLGY